MNQEPPPPPPQQVEEIPMIAMTIDIKFGFYADGRIDFGLNSRKFALRSPAGLLLPNPLEIEHVSGMEIALNLNQAMQTVLQQEYVKQAEAERAEASGLKLVTS